MKFGSIVLTLILLALPPISQAQTEADTIRETTHDVLVQLNQNRERLTKDPGLIQQVVRKLIVPHFDFELMSKLVMGNYWETFSDFEQTCFVSGFRNLLVERYAYILLSYDEQRISYDPVEDIGDKGYRLIRQTISREGAKPLPVEYVMKQSGDEWKVVDLVIDGVSLVRAHRGMLQSRIHTQGREYFINSFPECKK